MEIFQDIALDDGRTIEYRFETIQQYDNELNKFLSDEIEKGNIDESQAGSLKKTI